MLKRMSMLQRRRRVTAIEARRPKLKQARYGCTAPMLAGEMRSRDGDKGMATSVALTANVASGEAHKGRMRFAMTYRFARVVVRC